MMAGQLRDVKYRPHRGLIKQTCSSEKALRPPDATGSRPQYGFRRCSSRVITTIIINSRDINIHWTFPQKKKRTCSEGHREINLCIGSKFLSALSSPPLTALCATSWLLSLLPAAPHLASRVQQSAVGTAVFLQVSPLPPSAVPPLSPFVFHSVQVFFFPEQIVSFRQLRPPPSFPRAPTPPPKSSS